MKTKNFIKKDYIIIFFITLGVYLLLNFLYVIFSPNLIKIIPLDFINNTSTCYRTIFHDFMSPKSKTKKIELIFGDSYSEGSGDEFLTNKKEFGIFNKKMSPNERFIVFGRGGFGNLGSLIEEKRCGFLLSNFTTFDYNRNNIEKLTFVFYEGNDLNNNLIELERKNNVFIYSLRFFFPLFDYPFNKIKKILSKLKKKLLISHHNKDLRKNENVFPVSKSGIKIGLFPQSAAVELTNFELDLALNVLKSSLNKVENRFPEIKKKFIYIPSVASSYEFERDIGVQSYNYRLKGIGNPVFKTTGNFNRQRNIYIRYKVKSMFDNLPKWKFCDATDNILDVTKTGVAVHGPIDWKHFNKIGYTRIFLIYDKC